MTESSPTRRSRRAGVLHPDLLIAALMSAAGCATAGPPDPAPPRNTCVVVDAAARPRITVGVGDAVDPRSAPATAAARLVFAQLFETLVAVDCAGVVAPALADEWSSDDGRTWHFRIAPDATFGDGTPVTARAIMEAWSTAGVEWLAGMTALGAYDLRVVLDDSVDVRIFATKPLAVAWRTTEHWAVGTGAYAADSIMPTRSIRLLARSPDAHTPDTILVETFAGDPRTALDAGVDALVTADPATLAYARARPDYDVAPLPWSRTHVLVTAMASGDGAEPDASALTALARDAIPGDARPAPAPFWWQDCLSPGRPAPGGGATARILYEDTDAAARSIAERLAALAWPKDRAPAWLRDALPPYSSPPVTFGARRADLPAGMRSRDVLAVVTSVPRVSNAGCASFADTYPIPSMPGWRVTPLLDTRDYLIHHRGIGRVHVDAEGTLRFGTS